MSPPSQTRVAYRFSIFEADPQAGELRKNGLRLRIQDQPFQILLRLLERPGQVVTREELKAALWSADTFVDFDNGLNMAVKRLRETLGDDADHPRFIETLPRRGYRFIGSLDKLSSQVPESDVPKGRLSTRSAKALWISAGFVLLILLSQITWIPGLVLFAVQSSLAGVQWAWDHLWIAGSLVVSSLIWIAILSLLAMALSAWVKWRIVAGALLLAVPFFGAGFAEAINAVMRTQSGHFINLVFLMKTIWTYLFRIDTGQSMSSAEAWIALLFYCGICLALLVRKVRAYEVVK